MTIPSWSERLDAARERSHTLVMLERRSAGLRSRVNELARRINRLEVELDMEQEDVERLKSWSWTNLFHTLTLGRKDRLELERRQALEASLRLQQAVAERGLAQEELATVLAEAASLAGADTEYTRLLAERERWIADSGTEDAKRLGELTDAAAALRNAARELGEAIAAGARVEHALNDAAAALERAENWGTYDMLGGGIVGTAMKHGHIDEAEQHIKNAGHFMKDFGKELQDVHLTAEGLAVEIDGFSTFADYFFDGLIADWFVQKRISGSLRSVLEERRRVERLLEALKARLAETERELAAREAQKTYLIERLPG